MNFNKTLVAGALAGAFMLSGTAQADVNPTNPDYYKLTSVTPGNVTATIQYSGSLGGNRSLSANVGLFNLAHAGTPANSDFDFKAFCVDIFNTVSTGSTYYMFESNDPYLISPAWTTLTLDRVSYLFDNYANNISGNEAAFQIALWEIINEADSNPLSLTVGDLKITNISNNTAKTQANTWLADVQDKANDYGESKFYDFSFYSPAAGESPFQTVMTWNDRDPEFPQEVSEPGTLLLLSIGLGVAFFSTRRRSEMQLASLA